MYAVKLQQFEGPLDLLLTLIESEKLDICQISLSKVTDEYLKRVREIDSSDDIADFLLIASKLLYLKSKIMLPNVENEEENQELAELEQNLLEYQRYKGASNQLSAILSKNLRSFPRKSEFKKIQTFVPPKGLSKNLLWQLYQEAIKNLPESNDKQILDLPKVTLEDKIELIRLKLKTGQNSFRKILRGSGSKVEIIVTFLALLDLIKRQEIRVKQTANFADLTLFRIK